MKPEKSFLMRILALSVMAVLLVGMVGSHDLNRDHSKEDSISYDLTLSRNNEDVINLTVTKLDPQPNGDHWSVYIILEEYQDGTWEKTTRDITAQLIKYENTEEIIIKEMTGTDGLGFVVMNLSFELDTGEYTIKAGVEIDDTIVWDKEILVLPLSSLPPHAVANIIFEDEPVKEADVYLDRFGEASIILDSSKSWDPDEEDNGMLLYTWSIGDTDIIQTKDSLKWTFITPGDYEIGLKATDPEGMYSEDSVILHVHSKDWAPDLEVIIYGDLDQVELGESLDITALIVNRGNVDVWGFDVYFYDRIGNSWSLFKFQHIGLIPQGMERELSFSYTPTTEGEHRIQAVADPFDEVSESNEHNNEATYDFEVTPTILPELTIERLEITGTLELNKITFISIVIYNNGVKDAHDVKAVLYINSAMLIKETYGTITKGSTTTMIYSWIPKVEGYYVIQVDLFAESNKMDNKSLEDIQVKNIIVTTEEKQDDEVPVTYYAASGGFFLVLVGMVVFTSAEETKYKVLGSLVMSPLYTRLKKEDTLNHEVRARVYDHIVSHPGDSYASILHALELKNGTLVHHLRTLERGRYIKSKKDGKFKRFYPWGTKVQERDPNYLTPIQSDIVDIIKSQPGVSQASIAHLMSKSRQSINYQIKVLADAGLINVVKHGISTRCYEKET